MPRLLVGKLKGLVNMSSSVVPVFILLISNAVLLVALLIVDIRKKATVIPKKTSDPRLTKIINKTKRKATIKGLENGDIKPLMEIKLDVLHGKGQLKQLKSNTQLFFDGFFSVNRYIAELSNASDELIARSGFVEVNKGYVKEYIPAAVLLEAMNLNSLWVNGTAYLLPNIDFELTMKLRMK